METYSRRKQFYLRDSKYKVIDTEDLGNVLDAGVIGFAGRIAMEETGMISVVNEGIVVVEDGAIVLVRGTVPLGILFLELKAGTVIHITVVDSYFCTLRHCWCLGYLHCLSWRYC